MLARCEVAGDLERELAGRRHDQRLRLALRDLGVVGVLGGDAALQHRDAEGQGLAGAGAGLTDQVGAQQGDREGHLLDGERGGDAGALERVTDLGEHPELSEGSQCLCRFRVRSAGQPDRDSSNGCGQFTLSRAHTGRRMAANYPLQSIGRVRRMSESAATADARRFRRPDLPRGGRRPARRDRVRRDLGLRAARRGRQAGADAGGQGRPGVDGRAPSSGRSPRCTRGSPSWAPTRSPRWRRSGAPIDQFHAHTAPADWLEGLIKAYVGDGLANDFYREIAAYLDPDTRDLVVVVGRGRRRPRGVRRRPGARRRSPPTRRSAAGWRSGVAG